MFCPKCGEKQTSEKTQFCSKCGFPTKGIKLLLEKNGKTDGDIQISARQKGIRQGAKLIMLSMILYPAFIFLSAMFPPNDVLVESSPSSTWFEQIGWAVLWTIFLAGVARIAFALIFEKNSAAKNDFAENSEQLNQSETKGALPPQQSIPVSGFGKWKETTDKIFEPVIKEKISGELR
jgi:hypothetical protein